MVVLIFSAVLSLVQPIDQIEHELRSTYQSQDWPRFFSFAQYYRQTFSASERSQIELLEPLALLRHCQVEILKKLLETLKQTRPSYAALDQMSALSRTRFKGKKASERDLLSSPLKSHFEGKSLKKISQNQIGKFDPYRMRIKVENLCE